MTAQAREWTEFQILRKAYLLDSTDPKGLWFRDCPECGGGDLHGLLRQSVEEFSPRLRGSAVEAEREFVEVVIEVIVSDGPLVRPQRSRCRRAGSGPRGPRHQVICARGFWPSDFLQD